VFSSLAFFNPCPNSQIALELRSKLREMVTSSINQRLPDTGKEKFLPANVTWKKERKY